MATLHFIVRFVTLKDKSWGTLKLGEIGIIPSYTCLN